MDRGQMHSVYTLNVLNAQQSQRSIELQAEIEALLQQVEPNAGMGTKLRVKIQELALLSLEQTLLQRFAKEFAARAEAVKVKENPPPGGA